MVLLYFVWPFKFLIYLTEFHLDAIWAQNGFLKKEQLLTLRKIDSPLEGHPTPKLEFVDVATGSLGQGLSVAAGMAYASKYIDKIANRYFCLMGDGETIEGSVWEACHFANVYKLSNLTAIVDINGIGQSGATSLKVTIIFPFLRNIIKSPFIIMLLTIY